MTLAFIALGANLAPERHLPAAVAALAQLGTLLALAQVYETAPVGSRTAPPFLNSAALLETALGPAALKTALGEIEQRLGRVRTADKNAARTIDLDIILYGDAQLVLGNRHIPDPELLLYRHIAAPLADLSPGHRHPATGQRLADIAAALGTDGLAVRHDISLWPSIN